MNNKTKVIALACAIFGVAAIVIAFILMNNKKYTVTFDSDGGTNILEQVVKDGEMVNKPQDPVKEGYSFVRWEYQNIEYNFTNPVKEDMTLKAKWEKVVEEVKYKVSFVVNNETKEIEVSSFSDVELDLLGFEEKAGFELRWYVNDEEFDFTKPLTEDVKLEGKYVKVETVTIKFNSNGGDKVDDQKVKVGNKVKEPVAPVKYGYVFDGWYINSKKYDFNTEVTKGITLYAKWSEDSSVKRYTVTFDSDKGSNVSNQRIIENQVATSPKAPSKTGYKFVEWQLDGKKYDFKTKVTSDITLKAKWRELEKYTVTFQLDDGKEYRKVEVKEGEKVTRPTDPSKNGYTFNEWQLDGKKYDFNTVVKKNIILKAKFTVKVVTCAVTFDTAGGSPITKENVKCGNVLTNVKATTRSGYTFKGWKVNGNTININTYVVNSDVTLTAEWEENPVIKYTVTFDSKGGTSVASQSVEKGKTVTKPADPKKDGNTFNGWKLNGSDYNFSSAVNSNITLTAEWKPKTYTIKAQQVSNTTAVDVVLTVWDGDNKVNAKDILLSNGTSMGFTWNTAFYNSVNEFVVVLQDGSKVKATK